MINRAAEERWVAEKSTMREKDHEALAEAKEWERRNMKRLRRRVLPGGMVISATKERIDQLEKDLTQPSAIWQGNNGGGRRRAKN